MPLAITQYNQQTVGVLGLARTGLAAMIALAKGGANVIGFDDSERSRAQAEALGFKCFDTILGLPWMNNHRLSALVISPGVPLYFPQPHKLISLARAKMIPLLSDIDLLYQASPKARFIGITGTNGKSTTTALFGHVLKAAGLQAVIGGNLGQAALSLAEVDQGGFYVLELSSYQLDLMQIAKFEVGICLNLRPDHLDRHGSFTAYGAAKERLIRSLTSDGQGLIGIEETAGRAMLTRCQGDGIAVQPIDPKALPQRLKERTNLPGSHNDQNIMAVYQAAQFLGLHDDVIISAISSFGGLRHRLQDLGQVRNVRYFNDSKATNADSTFYALAAFHSPIYWIAGGRSKEAGYDNLIPLLPRLAGAWLYGEAAGEIASFLKTNCGDDFPLFCCQNLNGAFALASAAATYSVKDDGAGLPLANQPVVLLSPACASFDQYLDFEQRGDEFIRLVEAWRQS